MFRKTLLLSILSLFVASPALAANYKIDAAHSQVMFRIKHLGISSVTGRFDKFEGMFSFDPKNIAGSTATAAIDIASINTNQNKRDDHLRSCDFFCNNDFPKMEFKTKSVNDLGGNKMRITGELTMRGVTKEIVLDGEFVGEAKGPHGDERAAFLASGKLNRKDFGLKWNDLTETGGVLVGDDVTITLEVEGIKEGSERKS